MHGLFLRWLLNAVALWLTSEIISGIHVEGIAPLFFAAIVLGIFNAVLRPLLIIVTLPVNLLTLGLFTFIINGVMLYLTASVVRGFTIDGFGSAVVGALVLSIVSFVLNLFIADSGRIEYVYVGRP
jgi:putative membrane protein